ncbi:MAG: chorismate-binding protein [Coleofasciculaceae cyanobacterium RL_1_1]|nr:chorismate-binding protein [Coleofasciculaceae cyanobacterium RL_1_1]
MSGEFSNLSQAQEKPREFAHIRVFFRPLPLDFFGCIGLYSEQAYDYDLWTPYRQGIHRLVDRGDHIYIENYALTDALRYAGSGREPSILETITPDLIQPRAHCGMVFRRQGADRFAGTVEPGNQCFIERQGRSTYLKSDVDVSDGHWSSWDRGIDCQSHERVWGGEHGPTHFDRCRSFASELPPT